MHTSVPEVQNGGRLSPETLLAGAAAFGLAAVLILSTGRLYALRQENRALADQLAEQQEILRELELQAAGQPELPALAAQLGLVPADPADTVVLHIRGNSPASQTYGTYSGIEYDSTAYTGRSDVPLEAENP